MNIIRMFYAGLIILLFILLILSGCNPTNRAIYPDSECKYNVQEYSPEYFPIVDSADPYINDSNLHDTIKSSYDNKNIRNQVRTELINASKRSDHKLFCNFDLLSLAKLALVAEYEFPESPDFVLLKYYDLLFFLPNVYYIGYAKSSNKCYQLNEFYPNSVKDNFNQMLEDNPGIITLPPICLAKLLIKLKSNKETIAFVDSKLEALIINALLGTFAFDYPLELQNSLRNRLYYDKIIDNDLLMSVFDNFDLTSKYGRFLCENITDCIDENNIVFNHGSVDYSDSLISVNLTSLGFHNNGRGSHNIYNWNICLDKDGKIISLKAADVYEYQFGCPWEDPNGYD